MSRCQANATRKMTAETIRMHTQFPGDGGVLGRCFTRTQIRSNRRSSHSRSRLSASRGAYKTLIRSGFVVRTLVFPDAQFEPALGCARLFQCRDDFFPAK